MGKTTVKATYSLDEETMRQLESTARRLGTSKSETIRRAIALLAGSEPDTAHSQLAALDDLQALVARSDIDLDAWAADVRREREAFGP